ncbi:MAG TPA: hypothetical protein VGK55_09865 [Actinomycetes bacterium]|jgi:hypothetical protein
MTAGNRESVRRLTADNWRNSIRSHLSCRIQMRCYLDDAGGGSVRGAYGFPEQGFGAERVFDSLDEALAWANTDGGGVVLFVDDEKP